MTLTKHYMRRAVMVETPVLYNSKPEKCLYVNVATRLFNPPVPPYLQRSTSSA